MTETERGKPFIHPTATVEVDAIIGPYTKIWHHAQVRARAEIGGRCTVGKGVFIDFDVVIGDDCKLQNYACVYHGVRLGRGVFVGPHAVFTNDVYPRATDPAFGLLTDGDWEVGKITVGDGATIGANSTILPNLRIGPWALVGAGAVVTRDISAYAIMVGAPARVNGWACRCGRSVTTTNCVMCGQVPTDHPLHSAT